MIVSPYPIQLLQCLWWGVLSYYIAAKYTIREFLGRKFRLHGGLFDKQLQRQDGRQAVVTGGSRGIGLEIVHNLLKYGYNVIIGSSSTDEARLVLESRLSEKYPNSLVEVWHLDLASLKSVKNFADKFLGTGKKIHLLLNNAGIMFVAEEKTEDGFEKHFSVNYLSHCLLTTLLLPQLKRSGTKNRKSRIINSTSCIHFVGDLDAKDLQCQRYYSKYRAYIQSKLAQVMFTCTLQSLLDTENSFVTVNCLHPGVVNTELMTSVLWSSFVGTLFFKTAKEGAETATYIALSQEMEGIGGKYLEECKVVPSSKTSLEVSLQTELWQETLKMIKPFST